MDGNVLHELKVNRSLGNSFLISGFPQPRRVRFPMKSLCLQQVNLAHYKLAAVNYVINLQMAVSSILLVAE